jgi:hypothetical protein
MRSLKKMILGGVVICIIVSLQACKEDKLGDPIVVSNINKEFYLDLTESLGPDQRITHFHVKTIEDGQCLNGEIGFDFTRLGNRLKLSVTDVIIPEDCIPGEAPAYADVTGGYLESKFYVFNFDLRNTVINNGSLIVEDNRYLLNLETEEGVILLHKEIFRVPQNTFWGYLAYEDPAYESQATEIFDNFSGKGEMPELELGYYGYFTINLTPEGVEITDVVDSAFRKPFIFSYDGNWNEIKELANELTENNPDITIKLFDDKGHAF